MIRICDGRSRFRTDQRGITSWHCFSSGPHHDPDRLGFGAVVGCDQHLVAPGEGFDWHAHRGVRIYSWVLEGVLRHEDGGEPRLVRPGELFVQDAGDGLRHAETNASETATLRFVQLTVLGTEPPPRVRVEHRLATSAAAFVYVARGRFTNEVGDPLPAGDWVQIDGGPGDLVVLEGAGELLVVDL